MWEEQASPFVPLARGQAESPDNITTCGRPEAQEVGVGPVSVPL